MGKRHPPEVTQVQIFRGGAWSLKEINCTHVNVENQDLSYQEGSCCRLEDVYYERFWENVRRSDRVRDKYKVTRRRYVIKSH